MSKPLGQPSAAGKALGRIWNSPTLTSWFIPLIQISRFVLLLPLVLSHLTKLQIAIWFTLTSISFFHSAIAQRMSLTFSRMIAFAMAGSTDLSPFAPQARARGTGSPNWSVLSSAYSTLKWTLVASTALGVTGTALLGAYAIHNLVGGATENTGAWTALLIFIAGQAIVGVLMRYQVLLIGMNCVPTWNRIYAVVEILGLMISALALLAGYQLITLVLIAQLAPMISSLVARLAGRRHIAQQQGELHQAKPQFQLLKQTWPVIWKGFVAQFSNLGLIQIVGVITTAYFSPGVVASYFFGTRLLGQAADASGMLVTSHSPRLARNLAEGKSGNVLHFVVNRCALAILLFSSASLILAIAGPILLPFIKSEIAFPNPIWWALLSAIFCHDLLKRCIFQLYAAGNRIAFYWHELTAAVLVGIALVLFDADIGLTGMLATILAGKLLVFRFQYLSAAAHDFTTESHWKVYAPIYLIALPAFLVQFGVCLFLL